MSMVASEEQQMFQDSAREFCAAHASVANLRKMRDQKNLDGYDVAVWQKMCELGWSGVLVPEDFGGAGMNLRTLGVVLEEAGRHLAPSPLISTGLIGVQALLIGGTETQQRQYLPDCVQGKHCLTLALEELHHHQPFGSALQATKDNSGYRLQGDKKMVMEGSSADTIITVARTSSEANDEEGLSLFMVPKAAPGLIKKPMLMVDSRAYSHLHFDGVKVDKSTLLGSLDKGAAVLNPLLDFARIGVAAELLGVATRAFEITLAYLSERTQFGVQIGSFQALKHRMADMFCELQLARSTVLNALDQADQADNSENLAISASLCKAKMSEVAQQISNEAIQMHGGIGMTDEHDIGLYLKRSRVLEQLFGDTIWHQDRYAKLQGY